ncbi:MAG: cytochrome c3 family protein [Terriglobia bacterium]
MPVLKATGTHVHAFQIVTRYADSGGFVMPFSGSQERGVCRSARTMLGWPGMLLLLSFVLMASLASTRLMAQTVTDTQAQAEAATPHPKGWWPHDGAAPRSAYVGPQVCASCHPSEAAACQESQMAHAMTPAAQSKLLQSHPHMSYQHGPYTYRVDLDGDRAVYSMTDGKRMFSIPLLWVYGVGVVGQTFIFRVNGNYFETEIAYYPTLEGLDIVAGLPRGMPPTAQQAFAVPLEPLAARQCILCHTTAAVTDRQLHVESLIPGVTCEACHGPGAKHVAAMRSLGKKQKAGAMFIFNPAQLNPENLENFCGACHRTSLHVEEEGLHGLDTVHYEPYRLEMSQCWIISQRITCTTCHDPHQRLEPDAVAYDPACLSCHSSKATPSGATFAGKTCPVATRNCVTCHMPQCKLPRAPFRMADHFIRIVGPDDACAKS